MSDVPPGGFPPPPGPPTPPPGPTPPGSYPPPASYPPPGAYPPPGGYQQGPYPQAGYQQHGYGWSQGGPVGEYAGFWSRFAAAILDGLLFSIPTNILVAAVDDSLSATSVVQLLSFLVGVVYYTLLEGGATGQTLGKRALSIRVVDVDTFQPGIGNGRGAGRYFARILSALPCLLGYLWMLWDPKKQTFHDKLVRTVVVKA